MKILVDTHLLIWMHSNATDKLSEKAVELLKDPKNELFYSPISVWEVYIKLSKHPDEFDFDEAQFEEACRKAGMKALPLKPKHVLALSTLKPADEVREHKDPMDRFLIAQAKSEQIHLISHDHMMPFYEEDCIIIV